MENYLIKLLICVSCLALIQNLVLAVESDSDSNSNNNGDLTRDLTPEEAAALLRSTNLPLKSKLSQIKIKTHGTIGYKRMSKKFIDNITNIAPSSTLTSLKRNRIYSPTTGRVGQSSFVVPLRYLSNDVNSLDNDPPPRDQVAKVARFIVADSDWLSISTISSRAPTIGFPFTSVLSTADGPTGMSSGNPYMYMTPLDMSVQDLQKDSRSSLAMTLAQGDYCRQQSFDPEDPRCCRIMLSGRIVKIPSNTTEETFAKESLFSRHPAMQNWPKDHGWFVAKMNITNIMLFDYFGGAKTVPVDDYYKAYD